MEKLLNPYDKECMRMAVLKHEETFREQVYELHRLYQIQKILMKNIANNRQNVQEQTRWNFNNSGTKNEVIDHLDKSKTTRQCLDLEQSAEEYNAETNDAAMVETVDETEIELTLGPSSFYTRMRAAAPEAPLPSDCGPSFSSSSTGSSHIKRSTTSGSHQKIARSRDESVHKWRLDMPISNPSFNSSVEVEEHLRQDRLNNPPWLYQILRLNMT